MGAWLGMKNCNRTNMALTTLGSMFWNLDNVLLDLSIAQGVKATFLDSFEKARKQIFPNLEMEKALLLWNDRKYGLKDVDKLSTWVRAARDPEKGEVIFFNLIIFNIRISES